MIAAAIAFLTSVILTPGVRSLARRAGAVAQPKPERWHQKPTAMFGGAAIFGAVLAALTALPLTRGTVVVVAASTALFLLGLADDLFHLAPYQKLIGQLIVAAGVVSFELVLPWTASFPLNVLITMFWLVGVTNAVNMLDNMDGLAAGVAALAATFLGVNFSLNGQAAEAAVLFAFAAALGGFLVYNSNPASIFMGDCGSMFVGFFLASCALLNGTAGGRSRSVLAVLAVPVLVLIVPIFDTTLVTLLRKLAGRAASRGGCDHTSHRLVALGLSERHAVWMLYTFALAGGFLAMFVRDAAIDVSLGAIAVFTVLLTFVGVHLAGVRVYDDEEDVAARRQPLVAFLFVFSHKRRLFEVLLDVVLILLASYFAFALLFGPMSSAATLWPAFVRTLPGVIAIKLAALWSAGVYRGLWRYVGLPDVLVIARAVALASAAGAAYTAISAGVGSVSLQFVLLDAILLCAAITTSRVAFRILRNAFPVPHQRTGKRVVIYGAGDGGELLLRGLLNDSSLQRVPVAFVDDDPRKAGRVLHGVVISPTGSVAEVCRRHGADELLVSTAKIPPSRLRSVSEECAAAGVTVRQMIIDLRAVTPEKLASAN